ncbi:MULTISPECIES: hypothetical protein [unclassified Nocardia]|uniref:hypothetical protein n=1 Tax=unclassified Nocardia TaxID=2637762 RepID=UPI001CE3D8CD|nr:MULTISPECIES: hypothetical protein [unclassified Nocardia]
MRWYVKLGMIGAVVLLLALIPLGFYVREAVRGEHCPADSSGLMCYHGELVTYRELRMKQHTERRLLRVSAAAGGIGVAMIGIAGFESYRARRRGSASATGLTGIR